MKLYSDKSYLWNLGMALGNALVYVWVESPINLLMAGFLLGAVVERRMGEKLYMLKEELIARQKQLIETYERLRSGRL